MFDKIKSLFIVEDSSSGKKQHDEVSNDKTNVKEVVQSESVSSAQSKPGLPDEKFTDLLLKAIENNNLQGFDYLEYKNSLKSIQNVIPDEGMRYKSAFEMAKTMGLTKEKLIESANHYISILKIEDKKFNEAVENQKAKQIQGRNDQLANIEKSITDKKSKIEQLSKEINVEQEQLSTLRNEIDDSIVKIEETNSQFVASFNLVYNQIAEDITKIKSNI